MTKTIKKIALGRKLLLGLVLIFSAIHCLTPEAVFPQETSAAPTGSAQPATPSPVPTATSPAPPVSESPEDLDFSMDTAEFEDFGKEDFVIEKPLDPKTETAVMAVKVIAGVVGLLIVFWLIRKLLGGPRSTTAG